MVISYLVSNWGYIEDLEIFKDGEKVRLSKLFLTHMLPEIGYTDLIASNISYILIFWTML